MDCPFCGSTQVESTQDHLFKECGLENVVLVDIKVLTCPDCTKGGGIVIPAIDGLHDLIADLILSSGMEIQGAFRRFLRKYSGSDQMHPQEIFASDYKNLWRLKFVDGRWYRL